MDEKQLQALANELAKNLKTPDYLSQFDRLLKKISGEAARNGTTQRPLPSVMILWNCVRHVIVMVPSNRNW